MFIKWKEHEGVEGGVLFSLETKQSLNAIFSLFPSCWEDKHFFYTTKKLMQQKNINTKEILYNYPLYFTDEEIVIRLIK